MAILIKYDNTKYSFVDTASVGTVFTTDEDELIQASVQNDYWMVYTDPDALLAFQPPFGTNKLLDVMQGKSNVAIDLWVKDEARKNQGKLPAWWIFLHDRAQTSN